MGSQAAPTGGPAFDFNSICSCMFSFAWCGTCHEYPGGQVPRSPEASCHCPAGPLQAVGSAVLHCMALHRPSSVEIAPHSAYIGAHLLLNLPDSVHLASSIPLRHQSTSCNMPGFKHTFAAPEHLMHYAAQAAFPSRQQSRDYPIVARHGCMLRYNPGNICAAAVPWCLHHPVQSATHLAASSRAAWAD